VQNHGTQRMVNQDLIDQYTGMSTDSRRQRLAKRARCQEFWADDSGALPEGFCAWAWANIHAEVVAIMSGVISRRGYSRHGHRLLLGWPPAGGFQDERIQRCCAYLGVEPTGLS